MKKLFAILVLIIVGLGPLCAQTLTPRQDPDTELWGFVNARGEWAINPKYKNISYQISSFSGNYNNFGFVQFGNGWGVIDRKGNFVAKPVFSEYNAISAAKNITENIPVGRWLSPIQDTSTELWGFVNHFGNWAILPKYKNISNQISSFSGNYNNFGFVQFGNGWGVIDRKGNFVAKPVFSEYDAISAAKNIGSGATIPASQVANYENEPTNGMTFASLNGKPEPTPEQQQTAPATKPMVTPPANTPEKATPPVLKIVSPLTGSSYEMDIVSIRYEVKTADGTPATLIIAVDGEPFDVNTKGVRRSTDEISIPVPRKEGQRRIQIQARDSKGLFSEPQYLSLTYIGEKQKPTLYTLAIGVGEYDDPNISDLMFGAKDARDVAATIKAMKTDVYEKIEEPVVLTDAAATSMAIKEALEELTNKSKPEDVVIIYLSGHAVEENKKKYYLASDTRTDRLFSSGIKFNEIKDITNMLVDGHCKVMLFMDTCHSGGMINAGNTKDISETLQLADPSIIEFYSSTAAQKSVEKKEWGNSAFTRALIDGLNGKAQDKNKNVTTESLQKYIYDAVTKMTNNTQKPIQITEIGHYVIF
jgi:hypothetical protein